MVHVPLYCTSTSTGTDEYRYHSATPDDGRMLFLVSKRCDIRRIVMLVPVQSLEIQLPCIILQAILQLLMGDGCIYLNLRVYLYCGLYRKRMIRLYRLHIPVRVLQSVVSTYAYLCLYSVLHSYTQYAVPEYPYKRHKQTHYGTCSLRVSIMQLIVNKIICKFGFFLIKSYNNGYNMHIISSTRTVSLTVIIYCVSYQGVLTNYQYSY